MKTPEKYKDRTDLFARAVLPRMLRLYNANFVAPDFSAYMPRMDMSQDKLIECLDDVITVAVKAQAVQGPARIYLGHIYGCAQAALTILLGRFPHGLAKDQPLSPRLFRNYYELLHNNATCLHVEPEEVRQLMKTAIITRAVLLNNKLNAFVVTYS